MVLEKPDQWSGRSKSNSLACLEQLSQRQCHLNVEGALISSAGRAVTHDPRATASFSAELED